MSLSSQLAEWAAGVSYDDLPSEVLDHARIAISDTLLVAHAGAAEPDVQSVRDLLKEEGGKRLSHVWAYGERLPPAQAAFLNSLCASALDYDSLNNGVHADVVTLPAAYAIAERQNASGKELITAFIIGSEIIARLRDATIGPTPGWSYNSALGVFGAAATSARLLKSDPALIRNALGIALSQSAGTQQANVEQVLLKRMQTALASRAGVFSALLAAQGMDGPTLALDGPFGWSSLYQAFDQDSVLDGLGRDYRFLNTVFKKYPVCACSHPTLDAVSLFKRGRNVSAAEVELVEVSITPFMDRLVGKPFSPDANPQVTAQFCLAYGIASILTRGRLQVADIQPGNVLNDEVAAFAKNRIKINVDPNLKGGYGPAGIVLHTSKGRFEFESPAYLARMTEEDHRRKRDDCRASILPDGVTLFEEVAEIASALERSENVNDLFTAHA